MRILSVPLFTYDELSEEAQEKALDHCRFWQVDACEWWDGVYIGAEDAGISIQAFDLDRHYIELDVPDPAETAAFIVREYGACDFVDASQWFLDQIREDEDPPYDPDASREYKHMLGESYLSALREEEEYLTSDESVKEMIEANEMEFTADGRLHA